MSTRDPRDSLATALRYLRQESSELFELDGDKVRTSLRCDATELLKLLETDDLQTGIFVYAGPFLKGLNVELDTELEEWVYGTREVIAARVRDACLRSAEDKANKGQFEDAARLAERAYFLPGAPEPDPEVLQRVHALMLAGGSSRVEEVKQEAESFGITLMPSAESAREQLGGALVAGLPKQDLYHLQQVPHTLESGFITQPIRTFQPATG